MKRRLILLLSFFLSVEAVSQQWLVEYSTGEDETTCFIGGDISGEYNYSVGFRYEHSTGVYEPVAMRFDRDGGYRSKSYQETIENGYFCFALGLGDGEVFVAARCGISVEDEKCDSLWFAIIDAEMEIIEERYVEIEAPYLSYGNTIQALINDNDEIVVVAQLAAGVHSEVGYSFGYDYEFFKMDKSCELLRRVCLENTSVYADISDFTLVPDTGLYAVFGNGMNPNNTESVFYIDDDLNYVSFDFVDDMSSYPDILRPKFMCVDHWIDESSFLMSVQSSQTNGVNEWCPLVLKMGRDMHVVEKLSLERCDTTDYVSQYRSMSYVDSNTIYVSTFWHRRELDAMMPNNAVIYLVNEDLDLLGRKELDMQRFLNVLYIQPTADKGCIVQAYVEDCGRKRAVICKLERSDLEIEVNVQEKLFFDVDVYPNPVSSFLNIDVCSVEGKDVNVEIFDVLGRRYLDKDVFLNGELMTLDVSPLLRGVYFYQIECDGKIRVVNMFIKE